MRVAGRRGSPTSAPLPDTPGFPRALARTLHDSAMAGVEAPALRELPLGGRDLARLLEASMSSSPPPRRSGRAALFEAACEGVAAVADACRSSCSTCRWNPAVEFELATPADRGCARDPRSRCPSAISRRSDYLETLERSDSRLSFRPANSDLAALRRFAFRRAASLPEREPRGDVRLFSAPGEGRECVEIARRILEEAQRGVRFDEIAVFLRSPREYLGLVENAFERAGINAWFDRGARRPHPSGRAFLAILSCAVERLSAVRFAEYLSLAQVPAAK